MNLIELMEDNMIYTEKTFFFTDCGALQVNFKAGEGDFDLQFEDNGSDPTNIIYSVSLEELETFAKEITDYVAIMKKEIK